MHVLPITFISRIRGNKQTGYNEIDKKMRWSIVAANGRIAEVTLYTVRYYCMHCIYQTYASSAGYKKGT